MAKAGGVQRFGRFTVLGRLAKGGMGDVMLAEADGRRVVIKRLLPKLARDQRFVAMLREEARLAGSLDHTNVCRVLETGQIGRDFFIAFEHLDGLSFAAAAPRLERASVLGLIRQAADGLHHAHEHGIVHRDVSPSNLFATTAGVCKVLDFGIAKAAGQVRLTRPGTIKGNLAYLAPEYVAGTQLDRRADVFSLGVVLYEALTGRRLFLRADRHATLRAIVEAVVPAPAELERELGPALAGVLLRALAREPGKRPASARELGRALAKAGPGHTPAEIAAALRGRFADHELAPTLELDATTEELRLG